ncbi:MAG: SPASM domain-containing protein, partial [Clostridium butyricum]|nr:SPASM domain-containing protein [Clostridium butyricum]
TASICFLEWKHKMLIGNLKNQSIKDIWNGKEMFNYRKTFLLKQRRSLKACRKCGQLTHGMPDNIDKFSDDLINRIER